jgi:hypothetical protein
MLEELTAILVREGIKTAAIIDDVFDTTPLSGDIDDGAWNVFLDDQSDVEIGIVREGYGVSEPDARWDELRRDDNFIRFVWEQRAKSSVFEALFRDYVDKLSGGKQLLEPLRVLLFEQLRLEGGTFGSREEHAGEGAQLLFLDLFLGSHQDDEAKGRALERVKSIVAPRRESPPIIVLMSSSLRLHAMRDAFRDEAELLGCQFRTVQKSELSEPAKIEELLFRLSSSYKRSLQLTGFLLSWNLALDDASKRFLKSVRRLDLRDYADLQDLILTAEGELIGSYLLEVFGQYFQFELEQDARLSAAALKLNEMTWENYPAPHFLPTAVSGDIADGMMFRSSKIFSKTDPIGFGDVLFSARVDALGEGAEPVADFGKGERIALLATSAACDLQHGKVKRILFLAGVAKPSELVMHGRQRAELTPVLIHNDLRYAIKWDLGAPVAWMPSELNERLQSGAFERVRRFRSLFTLQLQQLFTSALSRVGTPVMPPVRHMASIVISYADKDANVQTLISTTAAEGKAVLLVGRTGEEYVDRLTLGQDLISDLRFKMQSLDAGTLAPQVREKWGAAIRTRDMFSRLEEGIRYKRSGLGRPFKDSPFDIVTVIGPVFEGDPIITTDQKASKGPHGPLYIEIDREPN